MTNKKYDKSWYQVFLCNSKDDYFSYKGNECLYENSNLALAHTFAYQKWLEDKSKVFVVIQPYDISIRGGYGFNEDKE